MRRIAIWAEHTAQAGGLAWTHMDDAENEESDDCVYYEFANSDEARKFAAECRRTAGAGANGVYDRRVARTVAEWAQTW